ncbi:MAG: GIN domain-containing protein [Caulobacteraceae bacterium]
MQANWVPAATAAALTALTALAAGQASGAPAVEIRDAVARVTVIPEDRSDIAVTVMKTNPRLPLRIERRGDGVVVRGDVGMRVGGCGSRFGRPKVRVWGVGEVGYDDMPQLVIHTPREVRVNASGAVFGVVGRAAGVDLGNAGCGDWTVADVAGPLGVRISGSGDTRAGAAASADLRISGSGDIFTRRVADGLNVATSGSGDVQAGWVGGPLRVRIAGSGDVRAQDGQVTAMDVSVAGSGDVSFGGVAQRLTANVAGSGDVTAARVSGPVIKHVVGSGDVRAGR